MGTISWPYRKPGLAGGQEGWSCCWDTSDALGSSLLGHSRNPLTRDSKAMPASLILHPFARTSLPPVPRTRVPARGELNYRHRVAAVERREQPLGALRIPSWLELWMLWILLWQRLAYTEGKRRRVSRTRHLCQQASQTAKRALNSPRLRREAVLGLAPSPEQPWH